LARRGHCVSNRTGERVVLAARARQLIEASGSASYRECVSDGSGEAQRRGFAAEREFDVVVSRHRAGAESSVGRPVYVALLRRGQGGLQFCIQRTRRRRATVEPAPVERCPILRQLDIERPRVGRSKPARVGLTRGDDLVSSKHRARKWTVRARRQKQHSGDSARESGSQPHESRYCATSRRCNFSARAYGTSRAPNVTATANDCAERAKGTAKRAPTRARVRPNSLREPLTMLAVAYVAPRRARECRMLPIP
jgi:hypothetical protein